MSEEDKIYNLIGLAGRAGKAISGADAVKASLMRGKARILICTRDISRGTLDKILSAAQKGARKKSEPALYSFGESERLGMALGRPPRTVLAIEDKGFADGLAQMLDDLNEEDADEPTRLLYFDLNDLDED